MHAAKAECDIMHAVAHCPLPMDDILTKVSAPKKFVNAAMKRLLEQKLLVETTHGLRAGAWDNVTSGTNASRKKKEPAKIGGCVKI